MNWFAFVVCLLVIEQSSCRTTLLQWLNSSDDSFPIVNGTGLKSDQPLARVSYSGSQLWKTITGNNAEKLKILAKLRDENDISIWGGNVTTLDILIRPESVEKVTKVLKSNEINYFISINDLQTAIDEENPPEIETDDRRGHKLTWQAYHRLSDIHGYLDYLAETYPDLCSVQTIGESHEGLPIKLLRISNKKPGNKAIWVDGGIHAREWISPATVTYIINYIVSNYENESPSVQNLDWYFTPVLNPDGYEYSHTIDRVWRKNRGGLGGRCSGVDLNRNFGYKWGGKGASGNGCTETFRGSGPFSEPETKAVKDFITGTGNNWKAYVSFHSYGQYILYPWGYDRVVPPDHKDLELIGRKMAQAMRQVSGSYYRVGGAANTLYPASGGSDDWAKGSANIKYAYTIELRDTGYHGFILPAHYIQPTAKEALAALKVVAQAAYIA